MTVEDGDFVSAFSHVATVANNNALEIIAYITEDDARNIAVGSTVFVEGEEDGIITKIAPALNPITQKIEIRIGLSPKSTLSNGLTTSIELARSKDALISRMVVPISALKITADAVYVFSIDENSQLVSHAVTLGPLSGNKVVIEDGVLPSSLIVLDARGLKEGDTVTVRE